MNKPTAAGCLSKARVVICRRPTISTTLTGLAGVIHHLAPIHLLQRAHHEWPAVTWLAVPNSRGGAVCGTDRLQGSIHTSRYSIVTLPHSACFVDASCRVDASCKTRQRHLEDCIIPQAVSGVFPGGFDCKCSCAGVHALGVPRAKFAGSVHPAVQASALATAGLTAHADVKPNGPKRVMVVILRHAGSGVS